MVKCVINKHGYTSLYWWFNFYLDYHPESTGDQCLGSTDSFIAIMFSAIVNDYAPKGRGYY